MRNPSTFLAAAAIGICALLLLGMPLNARAAQGSGFLVGVQSDNLLAQPNPPEQKAAIAAIAKSGAQLVRVTLSWRTVAQNCGTLAQTSAAKLRNPDASCYDWSLIDPVVRAARREHIAVMLSPSQVPPALNGGADAYTVGTGAQFAAVRKAYTSFVHAAAARYGEYSSIGTVQYWTIWNEPNSHTFWEPFSKGTSPRDYARLVEQAVPAIHSANPEAEVAAGPTGPNSIGEKPLDYVKAVQKAWKHDHAQPKIAAWAHNPYPGFGAAPSHHTFHKPSVGIANISDLFTALNSARVTYGLPVWSTEFSYQTDPPDTVIGVGWYDQASWLAQYLSISAHTARMPIALWYVLRDPVDPNDWQSGLLTVNGKKKPSYAMFQRPIAPASSIALPGRGVKIWGRSNLAALRAAQGKGSGEPTLVASTDAGAHWRPIAGAHAAAGGIEARFRPDRNALVAVRDAYGRGPARRVIALTPAGIVDTALYVATTPAWAISLGCVLAL